jgi:hypothetical protein
MQGKIDIYNLFKSSIEKVTARRGEIELHKILDL